MTLSPGPERPARLVVATWNVHSGVPARWSRRSFAESLALLADVRPDALALQEVECDPRSHRPAPRSAEILEASRLPYRALFPLSPSHQTPGYALGVGLASRWAPVSLRRHRLPKPGTHAARAATTPGFEPHDKGLLVAVVPTALGALAFGSVHVFPFHRFGVTAQDPAVASVWDCLAGTIDGIDADAVVVAGDYNTGDRALLLERLSRRRLASATAGAATRPSGASFDDVLVSSALSVQVCSTLATFSDHHLVVAELAAAGGGHGTARA